MAKSPNQKNKILLILEYLYQNSDENNFVTSGKLLSYLEHNGVTAERKSIYSDVEVLGNMGFDIIMKKGKDGGYALVSREFELAELKLLVDAVQSSKFISEKKSNALIKKIEKLTSHYEGCKLQRQVYVADRVKTDNETVFYNIDSIHTAIAAQKQISFVYLAWNMQKQLVPRNDGKRYVVNPLLLVWDNENYYLVAADTNEDKVKHYRVDKMVDIVIMDKTYDKSAYEISPAEYEKLHFSMFSGEVEIVKVCFASGLAGAVIDRFGKDVTIIPRDNDCFEARFKVKVSNQFFSWITSFGTDAKIIGPENVVEQYRKLIKDIWNNLQ